RAELLEDDTKIDKFNKDLDELEMMVKGALQTVRDTDLHENLAQVDVAEVMRSIAEGHNRNSIKVHLPVADIAPLMGKPL
ncbi:two-component sensor histidine kinase, partial [Halomonas sp. SIMBA_159]